MITEKESYEAMLYMLKTYWQQTGSTDILSRGEYWRQKDTPADTAFWEYWLEAVKQEGPPTFKKLTPC